MTTAHIASPTLLQDLERALGIMAEVVARDLAALPIFERIDREWRAARETVALRDRDDPIEKARALVRLRKEARV